jgi:hypothetical protein
MFDSPESLIKYGNRIVYKLGDETFAKVIQFMAKISWLIFIWNMGGYFNAATGYGILRNCDMANMDYISPEGTTHRINVIPNTWQELNKYCVVKPTRILPKECVKEYSYECYNRKGISYLLISLLTILIVSYTLYTKIVKKTVFYNNVVKYIKKIASRIR